MLKENKEYVIKLSKRFEDRVGVDSLIESGTNPQKAIRLAFEKIGYKVRIIRTHSYSLDPEGDIVARLNTENGFDCFYKVRTMIQLPK